MSDKANDAWQDGEAYEPFVGRWSRLVAAEFVPWLGVAPGANWVDVGCGTGALTESILGLAAPTRIAAVDASRGYIDYASRHVRDARASFTVGDAMSLPHAEKTANVAVAGLSLNFVPVPQRAVEEMRRVVAPGGIVAAYVWDYADGMQLIRRFWDAAVALDPAAEALDEGRRFPLCERTALEETFRQAHLQRIESGAIEVPTLFRDFADYWHPFLGGQGPAPGYTMKLDESRRRALREKIRAELPIGADGSIALTARAWVVRGERG